MLGDQSLSKQVHRVKSHTELVSHRDVCTSLQGLHEGLGAGLGSSAKVIDQVSLGHSSSSIGLIWFVGNEINVQLLPRVVYQGLSHSHL